MTSGFGVEGRFMRTETSAVRLKLRVCNYVHRALSVGY